MIMLETRAVIVQTNKKYALVQADQANGCEQCDGKGCGAGKLGQLFCSKPRRFRVDNPINANVGDQVIISVGEGAVLRGIGLVYLLPLILLLAGAMLGNNVAAQTEQRDGYAALGALLGLTVGFVLAGWLSSRHARNRFQPYISRLWGE